MATPVTPNINKVALYQLMLACATSTELRDFCFRLEVIYESVVAPIDVVQTAIQKTINYFDMRGRLPELIAEAKREFPNIDWQPAYDTHTEAPTVTGITITPDPASARTAAVGPTIVVHGSGTIASPKPKKMERNPGPLRIFLCHAREDKLAVRDLHQRLKAEGFDPWLDAERLRKGQRWRAEIPKAIQTCDVILVCLSQQSAKKDGYIKQEIGFALDIADKQPPDATFIIPVRLEDCHYPERLGDWQGADLFDADDVERLLRDLKELAQGFAPTPAIVPPLSPAPKPIEAPTVIVAPPKAKLNPLLIDLPKLNFRLELVHIPAGPFTMGGDGKYDGQPIHEVELPEYWIGKYPVTNVQYAIYAKATRRKFGLPKGKDNHPVVNVNWKDVLAFCDWLSKESGRKIVLPSEAEWEKAARGPSTNSGGTPLTNSGDERIYPWGNQAPDKTLCNSNNNEGGTTRVDKYIATGLSPYGCADMAGNVWEWTRSMRKSYPYVPNDGRESLDADKVRVVRGGSWYNVEDRVRAACRYYPFLSAFDSLGFRVGCVSALLP